MCVLEKLLRFCCGSMAYNQRYLGVAGNQIGLIDRVTGAVSKWRGAKNITSMQMDDAYIYEKTTSGTYYVFDLQTKSLQYKGYCREKKATAHDGKFFLYEAGVVLDVLSLKDDAYYFVKYNLETQAYEKRRVCDSDYFCTDWFVEYAERKAYLLFKEKCCLNRPQTNCRLSVVNIDTLQIETEIPMTLAHGTVPIALIDAHSVLLKDMQIVDTNTGTFVPLALNVQTQADSRGYYVRARTLPHNRLLLIFSKCVLLYDLSAHTLLKSYPCQYGDNAICLDGNIYIATWDGLFTETEPEINNV